MVSALEVADIFRRQGVVVRQARAGDLGGVERRIMGAITACRTAVLGGHVEQCDDCGATRIAYNSCRNRHCPKCQGLTQAQWLADRQAELLPVPYFHVVFTLPAPGGEIAFQNKSIVYAILFRTAAETLATIAANPRHLGAKLGMTMVLHTWGQTLQHHPHIHCVVPGGGPSLDGTRWIACALGHKACRDNRSVQYHRVPRRFEALALARGDGRYGRLLKTIGRLQLLILDDWGLSVLNPPERRDLLEILDDRHGRASTIVTSQIPVEHWHDVIGDPTLGDAILDRLVHNAHRLQLTGESMRKQNARNQTLDANSNA